MRLIDADKIDFDKVFIGNSDFAKEMRKAAQELISNEPTAYDVDKKAKALKGLFVKWFGENWGMGPYLVRAIEIVKTKENISGLEEFLGKIFEETHNVGENGNSDDCAREKGKMRKILFRGKYVDTLPNLDRGWVYGYLCDEKYINSPELEGEVLIDTETICEYTGLKDKNGKKIFEGDICKDGDNIVRILWNDKYQWGVEISETDNVLSKGLIFPLWRYDKCEENGNRQLEVIGNIFDNPELIASCKGDKERNGTGKLQSIFCLNVDCENYFEGSCMKIFEENTVHISSEGKCEDFKKGKYAGYAEMEG